MRALVIAVAVALIPGAVHARAPAAAVQARKLERAQADLEKLRSDSRRRKYRDAWEAVLRELDGAVKAAPNGPRAAEAALAAARARADLWDVTRSPVDEKAAIAAFVKVDDEHRGPAGAQALAAALGLATRAGDTSEGASIARRLADHYPADAKAFVGPIAEKEKEDEKENDDDGDDAEETAPEPEAPANPPSKSTPIVRAVKDAVAAITEPEEEPATAAKAREMRSAALASGSSLATQLGLKVRRVVVDAGHGGKDTGAIGPHKVREKDMALSIARKVASRLRSLGFNVIMTRNEDRFVSLDERTRIANDARADLFISIHCNAAKRRKLEGVETWTLNVASDRYAARLAAFENAEADRTVSDLRLILADLATKANATDARDLAQSVQSSLVRTLRSRVGKVRDHGVKQALFYVLLGTHMPSILVETGFISNPAEESRLKSTRFQEGTAEAIARGVKDFVDGRRRLALAP
ncbi:MAG: N-acetylmuramoyl-L-alanine amidase [Myxococcales bacterium]|nr:N-acetylmuramoyl-L-alanine amidase [Myxococcales bacterium]